MSIPSYLRISFKKFSSFAEHDFGSQTGQERKKGAQAFFHQNGKQEHIFTNHEISWKISLISFYLFFIFWPNVVRVSLIFKIFEIGRVNLLNVKKKLFEK